MSFEIYKKRKINELTAIYQSTLISLRNRLNINIDFINRANIGKQMKIQLLQKLQIEYNKKIAKVTAEYNMNINNIMPNKNALLIGINYIGTPYKLFGCINDTNNIKSFLQKSFQYTKFTMLTDNTTVKPNKINILNSLMNLLKNSNEGDHLFFLFSGHGTCTVDFNGDEIDGQDEMIVPLQFNTYISDDELNTIIRTYLKDGVTLFMLFDSCFSGTIVDLKYNYLTENNILVQNQLETKGQVICISGCKDDQTSADANIQNLYEGAMTFSFLKTVQDLGIHISLKMLVENMRTILNQNGFSQIPQLSSGKSINIENSFSSFLM